MERNVGREAREGWSMAHTFINVNMYVWPANKEPECWAWRQEGGFVDHAWVCPAKNEPGRWAWR